MLLRRSKLLTTIGMVLTITVLIITGCSSRPDSNPAPAQSPASNEQSTKAASAPAASDVRVFVDPDTGRIREPTPAEAAALEAQARKSAQSVSRESDKRSQQIVHADGSIEVLLDKSHRQPLVGCVQGDGPIEMDHKCDPHTSSSGERK